MITTSVWDTLQRTFERTYPTSGSDYMHALYQEFLHETDQVAELAINRIIETKTVLPKIRKVREVIEWARAEARRKVENPSGGFDAYRCSDCGQPVKLEDGQAHTMACTFGKIEF